MATARDARGELLSFDWLGACRRAVEGLREVLADNPTSKERVIETGETGGGGDQTLVIDEGHVVVSPPGEAHGFTNTGSSELRLVAIHGGARFETEWLAGPDPAWTSRPTDE